VSADGTECIHAVVAEHAPTTTLCLDTFHDLSWATGALDEVRRVEWNQLRAAGRHHAAREFKGLRWALLRNRENLAGTQRATIRDLAGVNRRMFRVWQLNEELRDLLKLPHPAARRALNNWLTYASRSRIQPFERLARTIRSYRPEIETTIRS